MSDLISRSELLEIIKGSEELLDFQKDECIACINSCDIAYDIDKVVEELEELEEKDVCDYLDCDVCLYNKKCGVETDQSNNLKWDKAIEIVKHGGADVANDATTKNDDVCEWRKHSICGFYSAHEGAVSIINIADGYKYCPYCGKKIKVVK